MVSCFTSSTLKPPLCNFLYLSWQSVKQKAIKTLSFFGGESKHPVEIGQGQQKELLLSETCNFRSLNQKIGKK